MVRLFRFSAVRPEREVASRVAAVPYDVVTTDEAEAVIRKNPLSFLRVSRPDADPQVRHVQKQDIHGEAREKFDDLLTRGVLSPDDSPGMYLYRVISPSGIYTGLCCCLHVDDYETGIIRRHEQTRVDKEEDRTRHIDRVNANTGPVVLLYRDTGAISRYLESLARAEQPDAEVPWHDGSCHQVFRITSDEALGRIEDLFRSVQNLYIADGHHRAKSAANVAKIRRDRGEELREADRFMGVLFSHNGVRIHGYSRLVRDLGNYSGPGFVDAVSGSFRVTPYPAVDSTSFQITPIQPAGNDHVIHLYLNGGWYECRAPGIPSSGLIDSLDVSVLQDLVLERILGIRDPRCDMRLQYLGGARPVADLESMVDRGEYAAAFSLQPVRVETVLAIADAGDIMPPKSTWFEPKLLSGLIIHRLS